MATPAHNSVSAAMVLAKLSELPLSGVIAIAIRRVRTLASCKVRASSSCNFFTMAGGVATGASKPVHSVNSKFGTPASAIVGTSG